MHLAGIDIGGTKICVCLGDETGTIYSSKRIATQQLGGWKNGLAAAAKLIRELCSEEKIDPKQLAGIGISSPGPISTKLGKMLNPPNLPGWENAELVKFFREEFKIPVMMNNDANAAGQNRAPSFVTSCAAG